MAKSHHEHSDEFHEELTERYARLMVIRMAMLANMLDLKGAKAVLEAPLIYNQQPAPDDTELLSTSKEDLYDALFMKMVREERMKKNDKKDNRKDSEV